VQQFVATTLLRNIGPLAYAPGYARVAVIIYGNNVVYEYKWDMFTSEQLQYNVLISSMPSPPQYSNLARCDTHTLCSKRHIYCSALKEAVTLFSYGRRPNSAYRLILFSDGE
jgi:hypothetical protein